MAGKGRIFILTEDGSLVTVEEKPYEAEDRLQALLVKCPDLLPGDQIDPETPRRWLLVRREMGVQDEFAAADRWSLDHLFLDQEGIPTFVECKRAADTRTRREVVAQMLEYAANATRYWPIDKVRQAAAETALRREADLDSEIRTLTGSEEAGGAEAFWQAVEENLRRGRIRLIFVSDDILRELRRLVEFLNEQMELVEVLAVEVKNYEGRGFQALVPRVLGITEAARERKEERVRRTEPWTEAEFLSDLQKRDLPAKQQALIIRLLELGGKLEKEGLVKLDWGKGRDFGSFSLKRGRSNFIAAWSSGSVQANMGSWKLPEDKLDDAARRLGELLSIELSYDPRRYPNITRYLLDLLDRDPHLEIFESWIRSTVATAVDA